MTPGDQKLGREALLRSLAPDERVFTSWVAEHVRRLPWAWMLARAKHHKTAALLVARTRAADIEPTLDEPTRRAFADVDTETKTKLEKAARTLAFLTELYAEHGIPFFLVKGPHLSERIYGDATLRPFNDLDVVVHAEQIEHAERLLRERGYFLYRPPSIERYLTPDGTDKRGTPTVSHGALMTALNAHHRHLTMVLMPDDPRFPVELHWHLTAPGVLHVDEHALWEAIEPTTLGGVPTRVLTLEATLVHVAVHAMQQPPLGFKLLHLADVVWLLNRFGDRVDPARLFALADAWGADRHVQCAIDAARAIFPFPLPAAADTLDDGGGWTRACLGFAGIDAAIVDHERPRTRVGRLTSRLLREAFWDLALRRPPRRAARSLRAAASDQRRRGSA